METKDVTTYVDSLITFMRDAIDKMEVLQSCKENISQEQADELYVVGAHFGQAINKFTAGRRTICVPTKVPTAIYSGF